MSRNYRRISLIVIRFILGLLFLASGIGKLIDSRDAQYLVELMAREYYFLIEYTNTIVITISVCEILIAVFLLWGKYLKTALSIAFILVLFFTGVLGYFFIQGQTIESCGCFGAFGFESGLQATLIRDLVLLVLIMAGFWLAGSPQKSTVTNYKSYR